MPIARVQLPDGRIGRFDVPEGTSPDQVQEFIASRLSGRQEAPSSAPQEQPQPEANAYQGPGSELARQVGRTARAGATGLAGVADIPAYAARAGNFLNTLGGLLPGTPDGPMPSESATSAIDALTGGTLAPRDSGERISDAALQATAPGVGIAGAAGRIAGGAPAATSALRALSVGSTPELVGGAAGGAAGQFATENDAGPGGSLAASVLGALGGGAIAAAPGAAGRAVARGVSRLPEAGPEASARRADAFVSDVLDKSGVSQQGLTERADALKKSTGQDFALSALTDSPSVGLLAKGVGASGGTDALGAATKSVSSIEGSLKSSQDKFLKSVSDSAGTPEELAGSFKTGAEAIRDKAINERRVRANDAYGAVVKADNFVPEEEVAAIKRFAYPNGEVNTSIEETMRQVDADKDISYGSRVVVPGQYVPFGESARATGKTLQDKNPPGKYVPRNSVAYLDRVYKSLNDRIDRAGDTPQKQRVLLDAKNRLQTLIEDHYPEYNEAVNVYAGDSRLIDAAFGEGNKRTALGRIVAMLPEKGVNAARELFNQSPNDIKRIGRIFARNGASSNFDDATKAFMADDLERSANRAPDVAKTNRSELDKRRIVAAVGPERAKAFYSVLDIADALAQAKAAYSGSQTGFLQGTEKQLQNAGRAAEGGALEAIGKGSKMALNVVSGGRLGNIGATEAAALGAKMTDPVFFKRLTDVLFDAKASREFLEGVRSPQPAVKAGAIKTLWRRADAAARRSAAGQRRTRENPSAPRPSSAVDYRALNLNALSAGSRAEQQQDRK